MNEILQKELANLISKATDGVDFLLAELPDVISQALAWYATYSLIWFALGVSLAVFCVISIRKVIKINDCDSGLSFIFGCLAAVSGALSPVFIFFNLDWLKILIAPKLWLIEYAAQLAK